MTSLKHETQVKENKIACESKGCHKKFEENEKRGSYKLNRTCTLFKQEEEEEEE